MNQERWARVEACFLAAADLPAPERRRFLETSCPADLRPDVEALLSHDGRGDTLLESIAVRAAHELERDAAGMEAGQRIGP